MDFFAAQDQARRKTRSLLLLFGLAVLVLVILSNIAIAFGVWMYDAQLFETWGYVVSAPQLEGAQPPSGFISYLGGPLFLGVSAVVVGGVSLASLWKVAQLAAGGKTVAKMLGGTPAAPDSQEPHTRQLLNVVEEMAIATGLPVPPVYLLEEAAINAFAAGFGPDDAVIGITRGAVERLGRDELQGVMGHEFSHILNGDMRLNMRLIAVLNGILFLSTAGRVLLRMTDGSVVSSGRRRDSGPPFIVVGLALLVIGASGVLCGRIIKAAVSRQREFLADASAVQFTRNPLGLAGALKKIGGLDQHGELRTPRAEEASHLFFAQGVSGRMAALFATHPPIAERIHRIDPGWSVLLNTPQPDATTADSLASGFAESATAPPRADTVLAIGPEPVAAALRTAVRVPQSAAAIVLACLARGDRNSAAARRDLVAGAMPAVAAHLAEFEETVALQDARTTLLLLDLAMPALKSLPEQEREQLLRLAEACCALDQRLALDELVVVSLLHRHLAASARPARASMPLYRSLAQIEASLSVLYSGLAWAQETTLADAAAMFKRATDATGLSGMRLLASDAVTWPIVSNALQRARQLYPLLKPRVLKACRVALADGAADPVLIDHLLRVVALGIDCPTMDFSAE